MLKKLRHRFVRITFFTLAIVVFVQFFAVNAINILQRDKEIREVLTSIVSSENFDTDVAIQADDYLRAFINPFSSRRWAQRAPYSSKYFVVTVSGNVVTNMFQKNIENLTEDYMLRCVSSIYKNDDGFDFCGEYRTYKTTDSLGTITIAFLDYQQQVIDTMKLAGITFLVGIILIIILIFPVIVFSKRAIQPVERSIEKQKQFITDASHELKTPIAVISANAEVIEMIEGQNEWIDSIKNQTVRLNTLVKNLVTLSKLEETRNTPTIEPFSLSDALIDTASAFETPANTKGAEFELDVQDGVKLLASESEIRQLISILCDNAVKYVTPGGKIKISCFKKGRNVYMNFFNDCQNLEPEQLSRLFDRFYRADKSRNSNTGGHGIGLSIARVVVERNNGKISAVAEKPNTVTFKVSF